MDQLFSAFSSINTHANACETNTTRANLRWTRQTGGRCDRWFPQGTLIPINSCISGEVKDEKADAQRKMDEM